EVAHCMIRARCALPVQRPQAILRVRTDRTGERLPVERRYIGVAQRLIERELPDVDEHETTAPGLLIDVAWEEDGCRLGDVLRKADALRPAEHLFGYGMKSSEHSLDARLRVGR